LIDPQLIGTETGQVEVNISIPFDISHRAAHSISSGDDSARFGDVDEARNLLLVGAIISIQTGTGGWPSCDGEDSIGFRLSLAQQVSLRQEDVEIAIPIKIEERRTGTHRFTEVVFSSHSVVMPEMEPRGLGDLAQNLGR
jgi:hypothetical protein